MADAEECRERIALAGIVALGFKEVLYEIGAVRDEGFGKLVDGGNGEDGVLPDVGVSVFETGPGRRKEMFYEFGFA